MRLGNRRVAGQRLLDLGGVDIDAAALDDVALATREPEQPFVVDPAQIAHGQIVAAPGFSGQRLILVIPVVAAFAAGADLADLALRHLVSIVVQQFEFHPEEGAADAVARKVAAQIPSGQVGIGSCFAGGGIDHQRIAELVERGTLEVEIHLAAARLQSPQRRQIGAREPLGLDHPLEHGGQQHGGGQPLVFDQP